ncbi:2-hydroxyhepta-2,4-diene-1,7-dioate isomerase [Candidatus Acidianus copahuensis]|uniref:2-hydroxyhepta-2,4-diene-1,7-dioate isomerase n=1 Tax=Candidatus Acidianus copahuensis TaxID=1160895 RepID=A0A031LTK3_9CREN|nr:fumarylacetoacetate hydrolase family protein [Candidatus Acidianus copahuensis]EZQ11712.1 2-hydroxyhepta-2,4-diene-1,7-dioate isomerase [Candidatus Acidianus copahuensis]
MTRFLRFSHKGKIMIGVVEGNYVYVTDSYREIEPKGEAYNLSEITVEVPVEPKAIICTLVNTPQMIGVNSKEEAKRMVGSPKFFLKLPTNVIPHLGVIESPKDAIRPEVEIGVILKKKLKNASLSEVKEAILGYTVFNDVTYPPGIKEDSYYAMRRDPSDGKVKKMYVRGSHFRNKVRDTFAPTGPWIVTPEEVEDVNSLAMHSYYDGKVIQEGNSSDLIFSVEEVLMELSKVVTIPEFSLVSSGSIGYKEAEEVSEYSLIPKDNAMMIAEVEKIGRLENLIKVTGDGNV